jgi:hypothetical protein
MLRALVLLLFLANLLFYLWLQGWLTAVVGAQPGAQREPERLARQVHPEAVRVLPPEPASAVASVMAQATLAPEPATSAAGVSSPQGGASAATAASAGAAPDALVCLEAGPYSLAERIQVEGKLKTVLRPGDWMDATRERPGVWMVYMGRYGSEDLLHKKEEELRRIKIDYTIVRTPPDLMWGLSLGQYELRADADAALQKVAQRGVRTARLVAARQPDIAHVLRIPSATPAMQAALAGLPPATWLGRRLKPCGSAAPGP